jgi:hypothetical protein
VVHDSGDRSVNYCQPWTSLPPKIIRFSSALKGNQETFHQAIIDDILEQLGDDFASVEAGQHQTCETAHGREETRSYHPSSRMGREGLATRPELNWLAIESGGSPSP